MNNLELEAFNKIVECGNFTEAAKGLYIPQSTLSTRINALEQEMGSKLFERSKGGKRVVLTNTGKQLAFASKKWQDFIEEVEKIKNIKEEQSITLSIGSIDTYNTYLFEPIFRELRNLGPDFNINIRTYNSTELYQEVDSGRLDVAFTLLNIPMEGIKIEKIFEEPRVIILNGCIEKNNAEDIMEALDSTKEVFFIGDRAFNDWHKNLYEGRKKSILQVDTDRLLLQLLDREGYWSIVPLCIGRELSKIRNFSLYRLSPDVPKRICYRIQRRNPTGAALKSLEIFEKIFADNQEILKGFPDF